MKSFLILFAFSFLLLTSCDGGRPPIDMPLIVHPDTIVHIKDPYAPDSICMFAREKTGSIIGEWMEIGDVQGIISEVACVSLDTNGFATRRDRRWVFKNDSVIETYGGQAEIEADSTHIILSGDYGQSWMYEMRGENDTILMVDNHHMWHDTLRITRLDGDTMILASVRYLWAFRPPERKSVVYVRRK